jgi:hypothetical protein
MAMQRVRWSALAADEAGRLCLGGQPFTGLAYRVDEEGIVQALERIDAGRRTGPSDDWLALPADGRRLDLSHLAMAGDYGPYLWRGAPVTGVVYTFHREGPCLVEEAYRDGQPTDEARRAWYPSGAPQQLVQGQDGTAWFEDGGLQSKGSGETTLLNLVLRDDGRLGAINVGDARLLDLAAIARMPLSDEVFLIGLGIDTPVLVALRQATALAAVPRLRLSETAVGPEAIDVLAAFQGLRMLGLRQNAALRPEDAGRLTALRPDVRVEYQAADEE